MNWSFQSIRPVWSPAGMREIYCYKSRIFDPIAVTPKNDDPDPDEKALYEVRIIDNDHNTYGEVIRITALALSITEETAFNIAWEVDHFGSCVVAHAARDEAEHLAAIIRVIGIEVQVNPITGGIN